jgi:dephospho-CoA kinase
MSTKRIGITGGIGSGKSTVCKLFETLGIPVYYADQRAKDIMLENEALRTALTNQFGPEIYPQSDLLDRKLLASLVFNDQSSLEKLNSIVHPAVFEDSANWEAANQDSPYTLREAALLFESGSYRLLDKVITVTAPVELCISRVMNRDGMTEEEVRARMARQMDPDEKANRADFLIHNDGKQALIPQVMALHQKILALAKMDVQNEG